jgi:hypothetical protein
MITSLPFEVIEVLRPKPSPFPLIRIGGNRDGAYLLSDDLQGIKACFSPGVNNRKEFEDELLDKYGIESHMCDYSSDPEKFRTPLKQPGQTFKKKWLDVDGSADSISLEEWVKELAPNPKDDLILQMDIEGAEYRNLINTPDSILHRFRIILIELHDIKRACESSQVFNMKLGPLLKHLGKHFICVHAHPNNCGGEFILNGTKLNLPNVHELTFLRRDRWLGVAESDCYPPMLPHPLDIPTSVPTKPLIFLNHHWLPSGQRAPESTIRMLTDQVKYLQSELNGEKAAVLNLYKACHFLSNLRIDSLPETKDKVFCNLAMGKPYFLSSTISPMPGDCRVADKTPFFFHTREGRDQSITIDLNDPSYVYELRIINRTNGFQERSTCLFYCLHADPKPDFQASFPVEIGDDFTTKPGQTSVTKIRNKSPRYLTIFSRAHTVLHFSSIQVIGRVSE